MSKDYSVGFTGDLSFSGYFDGEFQNKDLIAPEIKEFFKGADNTVINYESTVTPCRQTGKRRLAHRSDYGAMEFVKENIHNPIVSFANNHLMDFSSIGVIDSVESAEAAGIPFVGAGRSLQEASKCLIIGNDNIKIGIIAIQYKEYKIRNGRYAGPFSEEQDSILKERIDEVRKQVDWLVLVYHGGDEFLYAPMPYIRSLLKKYLDWGCDVIVAHHPHVVQGYEYFGKKAIFYSLGNFIFDTDYQRTQDGTDNGVILKLNFSKETFSFEKMNIVIDRETMTVKPGKEDPHFCDITHMNYGQLWKTEALRKEQVKKKAKALKALEISQRKERAVDEYIEYLQLKNKIELQFSGKSEDIDSASADNDELRKELKKIVAENDLNYANEIADFMADSDEESFDDTSEPKKKGESGLITFMKKVYKRLVVNRKTNYRQIVVILGGKWAKLFYKNKHMFQ